ncbi:MAG: peptidoglycan DD-metalloendopeptidase family protein [Candidatus Xenobia bacterium]
MKPHHSNGIRALCATVTFGMWLSFGSPVLAAPAPSTLPGQVPGLPTLQLPNSPATTSTAPGRSPVTPSTPRKPATRPKPVVNKTAKKVTQQNYREVVPGVLKAMGQSPSPSLLTENAPAPGIDPTRQAGAMSLDQLLAVIHRSHPEAQVTGSFYDWRTESIYRRNAGLHLGYDIAYGAGNLVPAAWPGRVVAISNWFGQEYGVTVDTNGYRTTYGHISPVVKEGELVFTGQPLGRIVHDHVDVKMRNPQGDYVDFGAHSNMAGAIPVSLGPPIPAGNTREGAVMQLLIAQETFYQAQDDVKQAADHLKLVETSESSLSKDVLRLEKQVPQMHQYFDQGLVAKVDVAAAETKLKSSRASLSHYRQQLGEARTRLSSARQELAAAHNQLDLVRQTNRRMGVGDADALAFVKDYVGRHPHVMQTVDKQGFVATHVSGDAVKEKQRLDLLERLFEDGAVSRREVDDERARYLKLTGGH